MTRMELVEKVAATAGLPKTKAEAAIDALVILIGEGLANNERIALPDLGIFRIAERAGRKGRNPRTGEEIAIPASRVVKFSVAKTLKKALAR